MSACINGCIVLAALLGLWCALCVLLTWFRVRSEQKQERQIDEWYRDVCEYLVKIAETPLEK